MILISSSKREKPALARNLDVQLQALVYHHAHCAHVISRSEPTKGQAAVTVIIKNGPISVWVGVAGVIVSAVVETRCHA
jgi:hypothetical protein